MDVLSGSRSAASQAELESALSEGAASVVIDGPPGVEFRVEGKWPGTVLHSGGETTLRVFGEVTVVVSERAGLFAAGRCTVVASDFSVIRTMGPASVSLLGDASGVFDAGATVAMADRTHAIVQPGCVVVKSPSFAGAVEVSE